MQHYSVTPHPIETILTWVKSGEIAIPEIQRPFVWKPVQVRRLLDSLYRGYPVGYLIAWRNPTIRLKDGTYSAGKRILIDGQQRVTALMASLLGREVLTRSYRTAHIRIAFHPIERRFEVANPAIRKDNAWIPNVAAVFAPGASLYKLVRDYVAANPGSTEEEVHESLQSLQQITNNQVGIIELAEELDIETVTEIFIRVNSAGVPLSQADFAMSKIAANDTYGGHQLRKAIDYFCHLAVAPDFHATIARNDTQFAGTEYFRKMSWLKDANDAIYDPSYTDMLRVAFTSQFRRGRLQDLVALLSGRNFETKQYEEVIAEQSFQRLGQGVSEFINQTHFERFLMIIRSAGFISPSLITAQNTLNFAYIVYLTGRSEKMAPAELERLVRRWFVLSLVTGRYSGNPETTFDADIRQMDSRGPGAFADAIIDAELNSSFWDAVLPQQMETSSPNSPYWALFRAAQAKANDHGFLSRDIRVPELIQHRLDVHHLFPKNFLKKNGIKRNRYNQIANYALAQSEINIAIGDKPPAEYFGALVAQCSGGPAKYGGIRERGQLLENLQQHAIPVEILGSLAEDYEGFLEQRQRLMAAKIRDYFATL